LQPKAITAAIVKGRISFFMIFDVLMEGCEIYKGDFRGEMIERTEKI
jgi:hypothetical protein